ncbi:MAG: hypothetical protein RL709_630 [Pseudomonadota bacterium]|jgi:hypothetical protein
MDYEKFKNIIESLEKVGERSHSIYKLGVNLMDYEELYHNIITSLLNSVFDKEGKDWIDWYLYERVGFTNKVNLATDKDGNEICYDIPSLWEEVKNNLLNNK